MKSKKFSKNWKKSKKIEKQRKYRKNAPKHLKKKFLSAHLSKELREKYNKRTLPLRKGDKVKIMRGQFKGEEGKINTVKVNKEKLFIDGIELIKKDGTKVPYPIHTSNVMITNLNLDDKKRKQKIEESKKKEETNKNKTQKKESGKK